MSVIADYHLHTSFSGDSTASMETQVLSALERGLSCLCFTDHYDPFFPYENNPDVEPGTFELDYPSYYREYLRMRDKYKGKITLRFGIELGLQACLSDYLKDYVRDHRELDFIIGSNHLCGGYDPYYPAFLVGRTEEEALNLYLEESLDNLLGFSDIDSCGHLDYVVRYLPHRESLYTYRAFSDRIDPILRFLISRGIALEVNTSPLSKRMRFFNPLPDILARYRELGGELITVGSDAHVPERVAGCFEETSKILKDLGFRYYAVYENRKPQMLPL
ncbi:MAG TPA: histidinol phosphate phosphatase [Lachnospiraceae bacterium]|nr:histidinol phosphate phosphatase [Lachnospiraceae bacterium]